jgi:hypothetical protein
MTPTTKQRIAREWLLSLAAITVGFCITYGFFYLGRNVTWANTYFAPAPQDNSKYLVREVSEPRSYDGHLLVDCYYAKPKNPGDFFNDLWPIKIYNSYVRRWVWNEEVIKLWLCILAPYFVFLFVRSIIWSMNALRRH